MSEIDPFQDEEYNRQWLERALARVKQDENGCWIWQGPKQRRGYGLMAHKYIPGARVHRVVYQLAYGQHLGRWDYVCHACDVTSCCNPAHMWIGTPADNQKDMQAKRRGKYQRQTQCMHGHEYNEQNTWIDKRGHRHCRICARIKQRIAAGWPEDLARDTPVTKLGYRPVGGNFSAARVKKRLPVERSTITPDQIRDLLVRAGISQVAAAKRIGISERSMRRYIAGELQMIEPAAQALRGLAP